MLFIPFGQPFVSRIEHNRANASATRDLIDSGLSVHQQQVTKTTSLKSFVNSKLSEKHHWDASLDLRFVFKDVFLTHLAHREGVIADDPNLEGHIIDQDHRSTHVFFVILKGLLPKKPVDLVIAAVEYFAVM